jgi:putative ABC transport system permease protein
VGTSLDRIGQTWVHLPFTPEGQTFPDPADRPQANFHFISPDYLRTLGITLLQGRAFTSDDTYESDRVAIIDAATARRFFPDGQAIGKRLTLPGPRGDSDGRIVGVVASVKSDGPTGQSRPDLYVPYLQVVTNNFFVHVRTPVDVTTAGTMIKQIVHGIDPDVPVTDLAGMEQVTSKPAVAREFPLVLFGAFAALALILAAVGIYAVTSYAVTQRTREIGVRMALGAEPRSVVGLVLRQGFRPIAAGFALGLAGAALIALAMRKLLFDVAPLDPQTFAVVTLALAAIALIACLLPARRATKVDPIIALRAE